jgi:hypothetical protein
MTVNDYNQQVDIRRCTVPIITKMSVVPIRTMWKQWEVVLNILFGQS